MAKRKSYRKSFRRTGSKIGSTGKKVMIGLGAAAAGGIISNMLGVNKMIPAAALGYFGAGGTGLISAIASDMLLSGGGLSSLLSFGNAQQTTPAGTVYS